MPFTPLHMGPGLIVKSVMQGTFSLMVFGWSQILIDIQPLLVMLSGSGALHGFSHTDILPLIPLSGHRVLYGVIDIDFLHLLCMASAVCGGLGFYIIERIRKNT